MPADSPQVDAIFDAAIRRQPGNERQSYLDEACGEDDSLRQRVERLLRAADEAGCFLESPVADPSPTVDLPVKEQPGDTIGAYKLMEQIGEGAFGLVFVAEQHQPVRRKVALKVIKPGMDTKEVVARFETERQALALMDHPNIAQVFDAGTTESGRPYFVMELVKGVPMVEYCDAQLLSTEERLRLSISVCRAVQHAHTKGVIHRDLKPSNILIAPHDGIPVVKVIDFGIAKAIGQQLSEKTVYTSFSQMIGTPLYMSPEQAEINALDVDTRSDVYSLGVLLYELLTGTTPFDRARMATAAFDELRRIIREEDPPKPSTKISTLGTSLPQISKQRSTDPSKLTAAVKGDLDWIVMKALEKNRERRYETANGLAMDIQRYLANEPIVARPPTSLYRLKKAWLRHKLASIAAVAVLLALVTGLLAGIWVAHDENLMRRQTEIKLSLLKAHGALIESQGEDVELVARYLNEIDPKLYRPDPLHATLRRYLGIRAALDSRWQDAADNFAVQILVNTSMTGPGSISMDHLRYAPVLVKLGKVKEYEKLREDALERFANLEDPIVAEQLSRACLLLPASPELLKKFVNMYQVLLQSQQSSDLKPFFKPWNCLALALMEYRRSNWKKSVEWCEKELSYEAENLADLMTRLILSMNYRQLGKHESALGEFNQADKIVAKIYSPEKMVDPTMSSEAELRSWFDWEYIFILQREAAELLGLTPG